MGKRESARGTFARTLRAPYVSLWCQSPRAIFADCPIAPRGGSAKAGKLALSLILSHFTFSPKGQMRVWIALFCFFVVFSEARDVDYSKFALWGESIYTLIRILITLDLCFLVFPQTCSSKNMNLGEKYHNEVISTILFLRTHSAKFIKLNCGILLMRMRDNLLICTSFLITMIIEM